MVAARASDLSMLTNIVGPLGVQGVRNVYDANGRLTDTFDADNNHIHYDHQLSARPIRWGTPPRSAPWRDTAVPNGVSTGYGYDTLNRLASMQSTCESTLGTGFRVDLCYV